MTLLSERIASARDVESIPNAHCLTPLVEVVKNRRRTAGWVCKWCGESWRELPPIAARLVGCIPREGQ